MKHTISVFVENKPGVLNSVTGLFSSRGFNIDSLAVGTTEDDTISRMTIIVEGDEAIVEQVTKQLRKLIDVIKVQDMTQDDFTDRELLLINVAAPPETRTRVIEIATLFKANVVDVKPKTMTLEVTGDQGKIAALMNLLNPLGVKELVRTGRIAMSRK